MNSFTDTPCSKDHERIAVIATGGTIACTDNTDGALVPTKNAADLIARALAEAENSSLELPTDAFYPVDAAQLDSSSLTLGDLDGLIDTLARELSTPETAGAIVTHGTDSMEDTALVLSAYFPDVPLVVTGAQHPADAEQPDGPGNLARAMEYAVQARGKSGAETAICFGGKLIAAPGAMKRDTAALEAFSNSYSAAGQKVPRVPAFPRKQLDGLNVPVITAFPGSGRELVDAALRLRVDGLVVEALGAGNMGDEMGEGVADVLDSGIPVVVTSRVPDGAIALTYGGSGGGATLADMGAIPAGRLRAGQSRMLLALSLAAGYNPAQVFSGF